MFGIDLVALGGIALGKLAYVAKKQVVDKDKGADESQATFVLNWLLKSPISALVSLVLAYGTIMVMPASNDTVQTLMQAVMAGIAGDSVANQKGK